METGGRVQEREGSRSLEVTGQSVGELFSQLASDSGQLIRDEVALARQEIRDKLNSIKPALIVLAVAGLLAHAAILVLCATVCAALAPALGLWQAILIVAIALFIISGICFLVGARKLKRMSLKPEQTVQTLEENKRWLKELT